MAQLDNIFLCAAAMSVVWTFIGLPIAMLVVGRPHAWLYAPALGWAISNVITLPIFELIGMSRLSVGVVMIVFLAIAGAVLWTMRSAEWHRPSTLLMIALGAAAILAFAPLAGIVPKYTSEGVTLASPIFDHSKIAMVDEIIRSGVPAQNPFVGEADLPDRIAYYYLFHFSAASAAIMTGVTGWEADAALTWYIAISTLMVMMGGSLGFGGRPSAALVVVVLASTASLRTLLSTIWPDATPALIRQASGFGGWLFQTSWAPQHVASAMCVVMTCALVPQLADRSGWTVPVIVGLVAAAAFQSSVWAGGVILAFAAVPIGAYCVWSMGSAYRKSFVLGAAVAAAIAIVMSLPFIHDQLAVTKLRGDGPPIALTPVLVLGPAISETLRRVLDMPAYWLIYLPVEFPAFYIAGLIGLFACLRNPTLADGPRRAARAAAILTGVSLLVAWLLASIISDNNDLGWRAVLPAIMTLISFAAAVVSRQEIPGARTAAIVAAGGVILSLPASVKIVSGNVHGQRDTSERVFATTPAMWAAVRQHTTSVERVANNPAFLRDMTPWPVNISWALLANRRSCYAGSELALPFAPISAKRRLETENQFLRIFSGEPKSGDIAQLVERFRCDAVVVTAQDGAWQRDPFASSELFRLVDSRPSLWRIYRRKTQ